MRSILHSSVRRRWVLSRTCARAVAATSLVMCTCGPSLDRDDGNGAQSTSESTAGAASGTEPGGNSDATSGAGTGSDGDSSGGPTRATGTEGSSGGPDPPPAEQWVHDVCAGGHAGSPFTCAVSVGGQLLCWGAGDHGRTGTGSTATLDRLSAEPPAFVSERGAHVTAIRCGNFSCALTAEAELYCWGYNARGRLGLGHEEDVGDDEAVGSNALVPLDGPVTAMDVGGRACAVTDHENVRCWGPNDGFPLGISDVAIFVLGDDEPILDAPPVDLGGATVDTVTVGHTHVCTTTDQGIWCWGGGGFGQYANGAAGHANPLEEGFPLDLGPLQLAADPIALQAADMMTCAAWPDGLARCWGTHAPSPSAPLGFPFIDAHEYRPIDLAQPIIDTWAGSANVCFKLEDSSVRCFGYENGFGQLGLGHTDNVEYDGEPSPRAGEELPFGHLVVSMSLGAAHTCAVLEEGRMLCWGNHADQALGYETDEAVGDDEPVDVSLAYYPFTEAG